MQHPKTVWTLVITTVLGGGAVAWFTLPGLIYRDLRDQLKYQIEAHKEAETARDAYLDELLRLRPEVNELRRREGELVRAAALVRWPVDGLGEAFDHSRDGIVFVTSAQGGRVLWVNATFAEAIGRPRAEILHGGLRRFIHPEDRARVEQNGLRAYALPVRGLAFRLRRIDEAWVWTRWWCPPYFPPSPGQTPQTACIVRLEEVDSAVQ